MLPPSEPKLHSDPKWKSVIIKGPWPFSSEIPADKIDQPVARLFITLSFVMWGVGMLIAVMHVGAGLWCITHGVTTQTAFDVHIFNMRLSSADVGILLIGLSVIWLWLTKPKIEYVMDTNTPPPPGPGASETQKLDK